MTSFLYHYTRFRLRWALRPIDRQIKEARRRHMPVKHLLAAKQALVHDGLARGVR